MSVQAPLWLLLLLALPTAGWGLTLLARRRAASGRLYADARFRPLVFPAGRGLPWPLIAQFVAAGCLLAGAALPVLPLPAYVNRAAVVVALDASRSMLATDLTPNRLEAAKEVARQLAKAAPTSTLLGLVTFSEGAAVAVAPTTDREAFVYAVNRVKVVEATSVAPALVAALKSLPGRRGLVPPETLVPGAVRANPPAPQPADWPPGAILLVSDGVSNRGPDPMLAAKFVRDAKVTLTAVGVGREGGAVTSIGGQQYYVPFDPTLLRRLAETTGGQYISPPTVEALNNVFATLGSRYRWEWRHYPGTPLLLRVAVLLMVFGAAGGLRRSARVPA